jgi:hypothetical protein
MNKEYTIQKDMRLIVYIYEKLSDLVSKVVMTQNEFRM